MKRLHVHHEALNAWHCRWRDYFAGSIPRVAVLYHLHVLSGTVANDNGTRRPTTRAGRAARARLYRARLRERYEHDRSVALQWVTGDTEAEAGLARLAAMKPTHSQTG